MRVEETHHFLPRVKSLPHFLTSSGSKLMPSGAVLSDGAVRRKEPSGVPYDLNPYFAVPATSG